MATKRTDTTYNAKFVSRVADALTKVGRKADADRLDRLNDQSFLAMRPRGASLSRPQQRIAARAVKLARRLLKTIRTAPRPVGDHGHMRTNVLPHDLEPTMGARMVFSEQLQAARALVEDRRRPTR